MVGDQFQILKLEENSTSWKRKMVLFFRLDVDMAIVIEEGYDFPLDDNENMLPLSRLMKKRRE